MRGLMSRVGLMLMMLKSQLMTLDRLQRRSAMPLTLLDACADHAIVSSRHCPRSASRTDIKRRLPVSPSVCTL